MAYVEILDREYGRLRIHALGSLVSALVFRFARQPPNALRHRRNWSPKHSFSADPGPSAAPDRWLRMAGRSVPARTTALLASGIRVMVFRVTPFGHRPLEKW